MNVGMLRAGKLSSGHHGALQVSSPSGVGCPSVTVASKMVAT